MSHTNQDTQRKVALITGASSSRDMGTTFCRKLASTGVDIFFTYWNADVQWPDMLRQEIMGVGVRCACLEIDLAASTAASELYAEVLNRLGQPTILINNAAYSTNNDYVSLDAKALDDHYAVNMRSTFLLCAEFARSFERANLPYGRIINLTSGQDLAPMPGELAYAATKGAISAFTKSLSRELASLRITVNAINPGPTDSTWMNDEVREYLLPQFPTGRIGTPEDAARLVAFLASEEAEWITGQIIHSEGGFIR